MSKTRRLLFRLGTLLVLLAIAACIQPMPQPNFSLGRVEDTKDMEAGTKPLISPVRIRTPSIWGAVWTMAPSI